VAELVCLYLSWTEWACGGTGIRVRLRSVSRKGWEFESPHAHSVQNGVRLPAGRQVRDAYVARLGSSSLPTPTMKAPFLIRYAINQTFWTIARPIRNCYRFFAHPTLKGSKVVIHHDDKVLLVRPNYAHRQWTLPGGGVDKGETFEEAGIREAWEEAGIKLKKLTFIREHRKSERLCDKIVQAFAAEVSSEEFTVDGIEIKEGAWFPLDALPEEWLRRVDDELMAYLERARARLTDQ
jgi:8-oxo-dGTP pyrophosphatase MutT (NUDIX family)